MKWLRAALLASTILAGQPARADPGTIIAAIGSAVSSAFSGITVAGVIQGVAGIVASTGLSFLAAQLLAPDQPKPSAQQVELRQPIPFRDFSYGRIKKSGPILFYAERPDSTGPLPTAETLWKFVALSSREIDEIEEIYLDDRLVTLDVNGWVQEDQYESGGIKRVRIWKYLGTDTQDVDGGGVLTTVFSEWTTNHRLKGVAGLLCEFIRVAASKTSNHYPNGEPQVSALIRASKVWDPRDGGQDPDDKSTWAWSDNQALCTLDYLRYSDGYGRALQPSILPGPPAWADTSKIDVPGFEAQADLCDELVPLKAGGTEKRYRVATTITLVKEKRSAALRRLLDAGAARLYPKPDGLIGIRGGRWHEPVIALDHDLGHVIEAKYRKGTDALSRYNKLPFQYLSPDHRYVEMDGDPWTGATFDGVTIEASPLDLTQVPSHGQARRLAKARMARDNPEWLADLARTNFYGLNCIGEEIVTHRCSELDISGPFYIDSDLTFLDDGTGMAMRLRSADATAFDWDAATEEGTAPVVPPDVTEDFDPGEAPGEPTNFSVTGGVGEADMEAKAPNDDQFYALRFWRVVTGGGFGSATDVSGPQLGAPNSVIDFTDAGVAAGTYDWFVTAETSAGADARSAEVGPQTATVT